MAELARETASFFQALVGNDFVSKWHFNGKPAGMKGLPDKISDAAGRLTGVAPNGLDFDFSAMAKSSAICNQAALSKYLSFRRMGLPYTFIPPMYQECAIDYPSYFSEHLAPNRDSPEKIKQALLTLLNEPDHQSRGYSEALDLHGGFLGVKDFINPGTYSGRLSVSAALACIIENLADILALYESFAVHTAETYGTINALLGVDVDTLSLDCNPYMKYFPHIASDNLPKFTKDGNPFLATAWFPYHYLCGMAWLNIVSAETRMEIPNAMEHALNTQGLVAKNLKKGALYLRCETDPLYTDVSDMAKVKGILYNALYPGRIQIPISRLFDTTAFAPPTKPRANWELLPIQEDEITVTDTAVCFQHRNYNAPVSFTF